jgi:transcriptional regulator with XRE-family HTH domain
MSPKPSAPKPAAIAAKHPSIGDTLRQRRRQLGLSMAEVAQRSELSVGYISLLERGLSNPSITALMRVSEVLQLSMDYFMQVREVSGYHFPQREREPFQLQQGGPVYDRISGQFPASVMNAVVVTVPAGHVVAPVKHAGEEMLYVVSGSVNFILGGDLLVLGVGDSVHLPSSTLHGLSNPYARAAKVLWAGTAPLFASGVDHVLAHQGPIQP